MGVSRIKPKVFITIGGLLFLVGCSPGQSQSNSEKPNVILVITDDQGYGDVGAHGNALIKTPHLDTFYNESFHLTNFHVSPTCAPTRASLLTGRYANSTGVWHTVGGWSLLREKEKTLANMFREAGYVTGGYGKWHLGDNYPFRPEDRGFHQTVMHKAGGVQQTPDYWGNTYFDDTYFKNGKPTKYTGYCTDVFFKEAISFIKASKDTPFFCYIAPNAPHGPYNVPVSYYNLYKDLPNDVLTDTQKRFYGMISNIDDNFGLLRKALQELKIADNTIIIFMTDNGTAAGYRSKKGKSTGNNANMRGTKGSQYDGGHRVPFFIHWKNGKISSAKDIHQLTAHIDVLPTLAELCGIEPPKNHLPLHGESLVPLFQEISLKSNRILITDSQRAQVPKKWKKTAVMQDKWRLVDGKELYNIKDDPAQKYNIAENYPEKVKELTIFYDAWWSKISIDFDKEIFFKLGHPKENPLTLTAHDIHSEGPFAWNQTYIRNGTISAGYWSVEILESGTYDITLRRYPKESNLAINATTQAIAPTELEGLEKEIPAGKNLQYVRASIKLENQIHDTKSVSKDAEEVTFTANLKAGKSKLVATFTDIGGQENTAYYVYVDKK